MGCKKAQAWGFDLIIGSTIFLGGVIFLYFYTINYPGGEEQAYQHLQYEGELVADSLLSEGSPVNWNEAGVIRIGLLSDGFVNETKLQQFKNLDYNFTRGLFRIRNEYFVYLDQDLTNGIGLFVTNPNNLARINRIVVYKNNITTMNIYIWN